ncbi:MAG TPA: ATPase, T2SS/T4P/T4SS family [bacterium]|nr:ATPase, T2SS/T4P/T4SS family [bacterium]
MGSVRIGYERLGDIFLRQGKLTQDQLEQALSRQRESGERLGSVLVKMGFVSAYELLNVLGNQLRIPLANEDTYKTLDRGVLHLVPEEFARQHALIPLWKEESVLLVAMIDPFDIMVTDRLKFLTGCQIAPFIGVAEEIEVALGEYYRGGDTLEEVVRDISATERSSLEGEGEGSDAELIIQSEGSPASKFVSQMIVEAIERRASDIHVEPTKDGIDVRYRIDGVLHHVVSPPSHFRSAILSRIKVLANMDIAEKRLPQDGRFSIKLSRKIIDIRVSSLPTVFGEKIVLRLLEKEAFARDLSSLGMDPRLLELYKEEVNLPHGLILFTGPTGSGKTTTLYSTLDFVKSPEKNLVTVEDPVEYQIPGIFQVQVNYKIGFTFAAAMRSILRQDPDIIMAGEIRDLDTAEMVIRAALTGHLVLSTLHTNDAVGSIVRLMNMGIPGFLVADVVSLAVAQRLLRKICTECKASYVPSVSELKWIGQSENARERILFFRGKGCEHCNHTGYFGREGVFEYMVIGDELRQMIVGNKPANLIKEKAAKLGMVPLMESGIKKVLEGVTTIEEVYKYIHRANR